MTSFKREISVFLDLTPVFLFVSLLINGANYLTKWRRANPQNFLGGEWCWGRGGAYNTVAPSTRFNMESILVPQK